MFRVSLLGRSEFVEPQSLVAWSIPFHFFSPIIFSSSQLPLGNGQIYCPQTIVCLPTRHSYILSPDIWGAYSAHHIPQFSLLVLGMNCLLLEVGAKSHYNPSKPCSQNHVRLVHVDIKNNSVWTDRFKDETKSTQVVIRWISFWIDLYIKQSVDTFSSGIYSTFHIYNYQNHVPINHCTCISILK